MKTTKAQLEQRVKRLTVQILQEQLARIDAEAAYIHQRSQVLKTDRETVLAQLKEAQNG